jgi:hypothetical protein
LRRLQLTRERADIQRQMDRLLEQGISSSDQRINDLGMRQLALKQQIDSIGNGTERPLAASGRRGGDFAGGASRSPE